MLSLMAGAVLAQLAEGAMGLGASSLAWLLHPALVAALAVTLFLPFYAIWRRWIDPGAVPGSIPPPAESKDTESHEDVHRITAA